jgi:hypothetical protein
MQCAASAGRVTDVPHVGRVTHGRVACQGDYESILSRSGRAVAARRQPERNAQTKNRRGARGEARGDEGRRGAKKREINPRRTMPYGSRFTPACNTVHETRRSRRSENDCFFHGIWIYHPHQLSVSPTPYRLPRIWRGYQITDSWLTRMALEPTSGYTPYG